MTGKITGIAASLVSQQILLGVFAGESGYSLISECIEGENTCSQVPSLRDHPCQFLHHTLLRN